MVICEIKSFRKRRDFLEEIDGFWEGAGEKEENFYKK